MLCTIKQTFIANLTTNIKLIYSHLTSNKKIVVHSDVHSNSTYCKIETNKNKNENEIKRNVVEDGKNILAISTTDTYV